MFTISHLSPDVNRIFVTFSQYCFQFLAVCVNIDTILLRFEPGALANNSKNPQMHNHLRVLPCF